MRIPPVMLPDLGDLDPGQGSEQAAPIGDGKPRDLGIGGATKAAQQAGPIGLESLGGPLAIKPIAGCRRPRLLRGPTQRSAAVVRPELRRPPGVGILPGTMRLDDLRRSGLRFGQTVSPGRSEPIDGRFNAVESLGKTAMGGIRPTESGKVAGGCGAADRRVAEVLVNVAQEAGQGSNVLLVVANDPEEEGRVPVAEELEVARRDLPAGDVVMPTEAQEVLLRRLEPRIRQAMTKQTADHRQEVEVPGMHRGCAPGHPVASHEKWPVEAAPVIGDEPAVLGNVSSQLIEEGWLVRLVRQEELQLAEAGALPPPEPDEERQRSGSRRETGGFRIEAEQGHGCARLSRQSRQPLPVEVEHHRPPFHTNKGASGRADEFPVHLGRETLGARRNGPGLRSGRSSRRARGPEAGPEVRQPPLQRDRHGRASGHVRSARDVGGHLPVGPKSDQQAASQCLGIDEQVKPGTGAGRATALT